MAATPELDLLNVFVAVAERTSFSSAAQQLGLPKSTVSRAVARLEASLGTQLLLRTTHTVALTTAGTALLERVAPLLSELHRAVGSLPEQQEEPSGHLRLTAATDLGTAYLADIVARFTSRYPRVNVSVQLTNAYLDLVAGKIDLALRTSTRRLKDSSLVARKVAAMELHLYGSPGYLARRGLPRTAEELAEHEWVLGPGLRAALKLPVPEKKERVVADDFFFLRQALRSGAGLGPLPSFLAQEDLAAGTLVRVLPKWAEGRGTLYLVHPRTQHLAPKVRAFRDFLLEQLAVRPL